MANYMLGWYSGKSATIPNGLVPYTVGHDGTLYVKEHPALCAGRTAKQTRVAGSSIKHVVLAEPVDQMAQEETSRLLNVLEDNYNVARESVTFTTAPHPGMDNLIVTNATTEAALHELWKRTVGVVKSHTVALPTQTTKEEKPVSVSKKMTAPEGVSVVSPEHEAPAPVQKKRTLGTICAEAGLTKDNTHKVSEFYKEHMDFSQLVEDATEYGVEMTVDELKHRRPTVPMLYKGADVWNLAVSALTQGYNILLEGPKATGKNVLADSLAMVMGRPKWDVAFHSNIDDEKLIGTNTLKDGNVVFKPGPLWLAGFFGGFAVLDEINMAKADAESILHQATDDRRILDVPGHGLLELHPATRFIGTMNYGYVGTKELNEALVSRFVVIDMPELTLNDFMAIAAAKFPGKTLTKKGVEWAFQIHDDLQKRAKKAEISTRSVDLRGTLAALRMVVEANVAPSHAFRACVTAKCFDPYERQIVNDIVKATITDGLTRTAFVLDPNNVEVKF